MKTPTPQARAERRRHTARLRKARRHYWGRGTAGLTTAELGRVVTTPHPCSCWLCGNPRRLLGEASIGERRAPRE